MAKQDDTPKEVTMQDLWRHISGLKGEIQGVETRLDAKIEASKEELQAEIGASKEELKGDIAELKGETHAIREVVDTLASQEDFAEVDRKLSAVSADTQATRQAVQQVKSDVSRLRSDVKKAGIPVT